MLARGFLGCVQPTAWTLHSLDLSVRLGGFLGGVFESQRLVISDDGCGIPVQNERAAAAHL